MAYKLKENQAKSAKKHYESNKQLVKERALSFSKLARKRNRKFIDDFLNKNPCIDCGEKDIIVLEFDHVLGIKINNICTAINNSWSIKKLKEEIEKCEIRCANCHRRITHLRRNMAG